MTAYHERMTEAELSVTPAQNPQAAGAPTCQCPRCRQGVAHLDAAHVATYRGKAVLALDPTEYPKRTPSAVVAGDTAGTGRPARWSTSAACVSRSRGARRPAWPTLARTAPRVATTTGYVDLWAGLVLKGKKEKQFLPLARQPFSNRHPDLTSQNRGEEAVLAAALGVVARLGCGAIIVADRGLGRKELLVRLVQQGRDLDIRVDPDSTVYTADHPNGGDLLVVLASHSVIAGARSAVAQRLSVAGGSERRKIWP